MNKPLSYLSYFKGNKKIIIRYISTLIIAIIIIGCSKIIIENSSDEMMLSIKLSEKVSVLNIVQENTNGQNSKIIDQIRQLDCVQELIPKYSINDMFRYFIGGGEQSFYFIDRADAVKLLDYLKVKYNPEDLPQNDSKKALVALNYFKNKGFNIGDKISEAIDVECYSLMQTDYRLSIVPTTISFTASKQYLLIPKEGRLSEMNQKVKQIINSNFDYIDIDYRQNNLSVMNESANTTFFIAMIIITLACSLTTGISTYIHYYNRRREMGVLKAVGYSDKKIILRTTIEVAISSLIALVIATVLIIAAIFIMNKYIAAPNGFVPFLFNSKIFSNIAIIPVFMGVFSLVPTWVMLRTIDKITLIQRGY